MRVATVSHLVARQWVPRGGKHARIGLEMIETPVEVREVDVRDMAPLGGVRLVECHIQAFEHGGSTWVALDMPGAHDLARFTRFHAARHPDNPYSLLCRAMLARTPLRATVSPLHGIDDIPADAPLRDDGSVEDARIDLHGFLDSGIVACAGRIHVRMRPVLAVAETRAGPPSYAPSMIAWGADTPLMATHIGRVEDHWAFLSSLHAGEGRTAGLVNSTLGLGGLPAWATCTGGNPVDEFLHHVNALPGHMLAMANHMARPSLERAFSTRLQAVRDAAFPMFRKGMTGSIGRDAMPMAVEALYVLAGEVADLASEIPLPRGGPRQGDLVRNARGLVDYIGSHVLPVLAGDLAPEDEEALQGLDHGSWGTSS